MRTIFLALGCRERVYFPRRGSNTDWTFSFTDKMIKERFMQKAEEVVEENFTDDESEDEDGAGEGALFLFML